MPEVFSLDDDTEDEANEIIGDMPDVSEHAIAAAGPKIDETVSGDAPSDTPAPSSDGEKDKAGEVWNAEIHSANKQKTAKGLWRRKRGKGNAPRTSSVSLPDQREKLAEQARETAKVNARMAGAAAANSVFLLGTMFGGEEWRPITVDSNGVTFEPVDEKKMMSEAFADYMLAKGVTDFPPGVTLAMCLVSYVAPRLAMPKTKERMRGIKGWIALRIAKRKLKKAFKKNGIDADVTIADGNILINGKVYDGSRFTFGDHSQRKDVQREEAGSGVQTK